MDLIHALQSVANPTLDAVMLLVTQLGSQQAYIALLVIAYLGVHAGRGRALALYVVAGFYLNQQLKGLFDTQRPFELDPTVVRSQGALDTALGSGFPSGHAQSTTTFWGLAAVFARRTWLTVVALAVIALVSLSRLYLGVHLPVDVLGGLLVGAAIVSLGAALARRRLDPGARATLVLGVVVPLGIHLAFPTPDSGLLMGAASAFAIGPVLVPWEARGAWPRRAAAAALGLVLVFAALLATSALVPDAIRHGTFGSYLRYLVVGGVGTMAAPALARALGLGGAPAAVPPPPAAAVRPR